MGKLLVGALIALAGLFAPGHHYHHYGPPGHRAEMYSARDVSPLQDMYLAPRDMY